MAVKQYKPTSPGRRTMTVSAFDEITKARPEKRLVRSAKSSGGRNSRGKITMRHRGGGHKRAYRVIDFRRDKLNIPGEVKGIEYDPNRSARIALLQYPDGERRYILAPVGVTVGSRLVSGPEAEIHPGNCLSLEKIPVGTLIHNIELKPGKGGQLIRSAGGSAQIMGKEDDYALIRMVSGEIRKIHIRCQATIGQVGNLDHENISVGKAGRSRWKGRRPKVRGVVMNPVDHPHGGGEGKAGQGNPHPVSPWGMPTKGFKTRKRKLTSRFIVRRAKKGRAKKS